MSQDGKDICGPIISVEVSGVGKSRKEVEVYTVTNGEKVAVSKGSLIPVGSEHINFGIRNGDQADDKALILIPRGEEVEVVMGVKHWGKKEEPYPRRRLQPENEELLRIQSKLVTGEGDVMVNLIRR